MRALILFGIMITALFVTGCAIEDLDYLECPEDLKGAKYCTMDYDPVCGDDGETYSNVCVACGSVDRYVKGACPE